MRITGVVLILFFYYGSNCFSQSNPGARQISLSHSDVALCDDVFALFNNPAGLSQIKSREAGVFRSPSPFGFKELSSSYAAYVEPLSFGALSLGGMKYGYELYKELKVLLGFSYKFSDDLYAGLSVTYHSVTIKRYGNDYSVYVNAGGLIYIFDNLRWGLFLHNFNRSTFGESEGQIPVIMNSGFSFDPLDNLSLNCAVEKDIIYKPSFRFGIDYEVIKYFSLRTGFSTEPSGYSAGAGINYSIISFDYALVNHPDLGLTHQAGVIFSFGEAESR